MEFFLILLAILLSIPTSRALMDDQPLAALILIVFYFLFVFVMLFAQEKKKNDNSRKYGK